MDTPSKGGYTPITLTLQDREILDCSICFVPLKPPIFQCENGHVICSSCCVRIKDKCPTCQARFSSCRCRAMEKILESATAFCENLLYGCGESLTYSQKADHESKCRYAPCFCPSSGCCYKDSAKSLYQHWSNEHRSSSRCFVFDSYFSMTLKKVAREEFFVFQETEEGTLFMVNISPQIRGCMVSVSCIAPQHGGMGEFSYVCHVETEDRRRKLILKSRTVAVKSSWHDHFSKDFLMVPYDFFEQYSGAKVNMAACIERPGAADD